MITKYAILLPLIVSFSGRAQLIENSIPDNIQFSKIQFARFPDPLLNRAGVIFFHSDTSYVNSFLRSFSHHILDSVGHTEFKLKFCNNNFRYKQYQVIDFGMSHTTEKLFTLLNSVNAFYVLAKKYKSIWNFRIFRRELKFVSIDTVFKGNIRISSAIQNAKSPEAKSAYLGVASYTFSLMSQVKSGPNVIINRVFSMQSAMTALSIDFSDKILNENGINDKLQLDDVHLKPYKSSSIIFYLPVSD